MPTATLRRAVPLALAALAGACLAPRDPVELRYYSPEAGLAQAAEAPTVELGPPLAERVPVRLRRAEAADILRDRLVWRTPDGRFGHLEYDRWSEPPAELLRRAAAASLDRSERLVRTEAAGGYVLDLELVLFGELRQQPRRAEVALAVEVLDAEGRVVVAERLTERATVAGEGPEALARELGRILQGLLWRAVALVEGAAGPA